MIKLKNLRVSQSLRGSLLGITTPRKGSRGKGQGLEGSRRVVISLKNPIIALITHYSNFYSG